MADITIQVLEGLERGRVFANLETPVTIGREEDNTVQLNDERISRFHSKIQEDGNRIILTDLDSTNGTRVNGRPVQMRVLRLGDQVSIGRCLLVYGSRDDIDASLADDSRRAGADRPDDMATASDQAPDARTFAVDDLEFIDLFPDGPPELPEDLSALQQTQLSDLLAFVHDRVGDFLQGAEESNGRDELLDELDASNPPGPTQVPRVVWQQLLNLEMDLAVYLREIAEPTE